MKKKNHVIILRRPHYYISYRVISKYDFYFFFFNDIHFLHGAVAVVPA